MKKHYWLLLIVGIALSGQELLCMKGGSSLNGNSPKGDNSGGKSSFKGSNSLKKWFSSSKINKSNSSNLETSDIPHNSDENLSKEPSIDKKNRIDRASIADLQIGQPTPLPNANTSVMELNFANLNNSSSAPNSSRDVSPKKKGSNVPSPINSPRTISFIIEPSSPAALLLLKGTLVSDLVKTFDKPTLLGLATVYVTVQQGPSAGKNLLLLYLAQQCRFDAVKAMVEYGIDVNIADETTGDTLAHTLVRMDLEGNEAACEFLCKKLIKKHGLRPDKANTLGYSAIDLVILQDGCRDSVGLRKPEDYLRCANNLYLKFLESYFALNEANQVNLSNKLKLGQLRDSKGELSGPSFVDEDQRPKLEMLEAAIDKDQAIMRNLVSYINLLKQKIDAVQLKK